MKKNLKKEKKTKTNSDILDTVGDIATDLLKLLGTKAKAEISEDKENSAILVNIDAKDEAGLLIGSRGKTILDLQTVIGMILKRKTDTWQRIIVNVGDWREKESTRLEELANQAAQRAIETGDPQFLYNLTAAQRRVIHVFLSSQDKIETNSEGEGKDRYLIVSPK